MTAVVPSTALDLVEGSGCSTQRELTAFVAAQRGGLERWFVAVWGVSADDADDLVQETFLGVARRWSRLRDDAHRRNSTYHIARNVAISHLRARRETVSLDNMADAALVDPAADPAVAVAAGSISDTPVWAAMAALAPSRREAVVGRVADELPYEELARRTGRSEPALRQDVSRGLRQLRRALGALGALLAGLVWPRRGMRATRTGPLAASSPWVIGAVLAVAATHLPALPERQRPAAVTPPVSVQVTTLHSPAPPARTTGRVAPTRTAPAPGTRRDRPPVGPRRWLPPGSGVTRPPQVAQAGVCVNVRCDHNLVIRVGSREYSVGQSHVRVCHTVTPIPQPVVSCERDKPSP